MSEVMADKILEIRRGLVQACLTLVNETIVHMVDNPMYAGEAPGYLYDMRHELCEVLGDQ